MSTADLLAGRYETRDDAVEHLIRRPLGKHVEDFDVEAIAAEVIDRNDSGQYGCTVDAVEFWNTVERYQITHTPCPAWCQFRGERHPFHEVEIRAGGISAFVSIEDGQPGPCVDVPQFEDVVDAAGLRDLLVVLLRAAAIVSPDAITDALTDVLRRAEQ